MVELATCRYADFDDRCGVPVRISVGAPRFPLGYRLEEHIPELCPAWSWLKLKPDDYDRRFFGKLEKVGVERLRGIFTSMSERHMGRRLVLLCYEEVLGKGQTCHRRGFAEWWYEQTGEEIREIDVFTGELVWTPYR